jgi:hypothetical protein
MMINLNYLDPATLASTGWRSWFIEYNSSHFVAYLTISSLLVALYVFLVTNP